MPEPVACLRHPDTQTRLRCATCDDPICPRCAVQTPVGQKCPNDARLARSARTLGTPRQVAKGLGAGVLAAAAAAVVMVAILSSTGGFLSLILSFVAGSAVGEAVRRGAEGNAGPRFRTIAMVASGLMMLAVWQVGFGILVPGGLTVLSYPAAIWGASQRFPWT